VLGIEKSCESKNENKCRISGKVLNDGIPLRYDKLHVIVSNAYDYDLQNTGRRDDTENEG